MNYSLEVLADRMTNSCTIYVVGYGGLGRKSIKLLYLTRDTREFIQFKPGCLAPWPRHVPFGQPPMSEGPQGETGAPISGN